MMLGLVAVIFIATLAMFIYSTFAPVQSPQPNQNQTPQTQNGPNPQTSPTSTPAKPNIDLSDPLSECISAKTSAAIGKQYVRGSLIASFVTGMDYDTAIETLQALGLNVTASVSDRSNFDQYHWLTVSVPSGQEFRWQCKLETSEGIKRSSLNFTFTLHE